jgi:hypothetical protein
MSIVTTFILVFLILASVYLFYYLKQNRTVIPVINEINSNLTITTTTAPQKIYTTTPLLFPNIRWAKMPISVYTVTENCSSAQISEASNAMKIWEEKTNGTVSFVSGQSSNADVTVDCLKDSSSIREGRKIVRKVGEGGPSSVFDTGLFNLTVKGKIYLFTSSVGCDRPIIAMHEMGHVLGLDHSENPNSVMYEYEECNQDITPEIISTLSSLYSYPAKPDLYFANASASQKNFYLSINFTVKNQGLVDSDPTTVSVFVDGKEIKTVSMDSIKPSQGYAYFIGNIFVSSQISKLELFIDPQNNLDELSKSNNAVTLI